MHASASPAREKFGDAVIWYGLVPWLSTDVLDPVMSELFCVILSMHGSELITTSLHPCEGRVVDQFAQSFGGLPRHWRRSLELGWKQKEKRVMWLAASVFYFHFGRLLL
jgi:hypothetical protein